MPDDTNNDALMQQFIERAMPKLVEAATPMLTEMVEKQLGGFKENAEKLLDEVQDAKRAQAEAAEKAKADADQFAQLLKQNPTDVDNITKALNPDPIRLTREQMRDPAIYRRAKAEAERTGTTIQRIEE